MNERINISTIAEIIAQQLSYPKRIAEDFMLSFIDNILEALRNEGFVRIKGLGTFKITDVESRISVSVVDGKRIILPSYKKVSFFAEDTLHEQIAKLLNETVQSIEIEDESTEEGEWSDEEEPSEVMVEEETGESSDSEAIITENIESEPAVPEDIEPEPAAPKDIEPEPAAPEDIEPEPAVPEDLEPEPCAPTGLEDIPQPERADLETEETVIETPMDELSGIDVVISTPESLDELEQKLAEAREYYEKMKGELEAANNAVSNAKEEVRKAERNVLAIRSEYEIANSAVDNLEKLVDNVRSNKRTVKAEPTQDPATTDIIGMRTEEEPADTDADTPSDDIVADMPHTTETVDEDEEADTKESEEPTPRKWLRFLVIAIVAILLVTGLIWFLTNNNAPKRDTDDVKIATETPAPPQPAAVSDSTDTAMTDSTTVAGDTSDDNPQQQPTAADEQKDDQAAADKNDDKPGIDSKRPTTHVIQPGESLTKISRRYYGTKDSVNAIIRVNNIKNPNNVPVGAKIKLP